MEADLVSASQKPREAGGTVPESWEPGEPMV